MKFAYCPLCGEKLYLKEIGDEGLVPFCSKCKRPFFSQPGICIITLVVNENDEFMVIRQADVSTSDVCVAGYVKESETAEQAVKREVFEEIGLNVNNVRYINSYVYTKKELLMLGFVAYVTKQDVTLSKEVDNAKWVSSTMIKEVLSKGVITSQLVNDFLFVETAKNVEIY